MKILIYSDAFYPNLGGVESYLINFLQGLSARGHEITVVTSQLSKDTPAYEEAFGAKIHRLPFQEWVQGNTRLHPDLLREVRKIKNRTQPDLISSHNFGASLFFAHLTRLPERVPHVITLHGLDPLMHGGPELAQKYFASIDAAISVSKFIARQFKGMLPNFKIPLHVIPNAIPLPSLKPRPLPSSPPQLLMMGRLVPEKGMDLGIKAFAKVLEVHTPCRLLIAGLGSEQEKLRNLSQTLGISSQVDFLGKVEPPKIPQLLNQVSLLLVPSLWEEPFGLVALEGSQMARPVIVSNRGALPTIIQDGVSGKVVPAVDPKPWAEAILELLQNPHEMTQMGQKGRELAQKHFSFETMLDRYEEVFETVQASLSTASSG